MALNWAHRVEYLAYSYCIDFAEWVTGLWQRIKYQNVIAPESSMFSLSKMDYISGFPRRLENLENENGHEMSSNMQNWPKVMEFSYQSWHFTNFTLQLYEICMLFATTNTLI